VGAAPVRLEPVPVRRAVLHRVQEAAVMGPSGPEPVTAEFEAQALDALRLGWGVAYEIGVADGLWRAWRRDRIGGVIEARGPEELRQELMDDHETRAVRRG
jgi:hypothetical protein